MGSQITSTILIYFILFSFAGIAQMVEQLICNQKVPSSILGVGTTKTIGYIRFKSCNIWQGYTGVTSKLIYLKKKMESSEIQDGNNESSPTASIEKTLGDVMVELNKLQAFIDAIVRTTDNSRCFSVLLY